VADDPTCTCEATTPAELLRVPALDGACRGLGGMWDGVPGDEPEERDARLTPGVWVCRRCAASGWACALLATCFRLNQLDDGLWAGRLRTKADHAA
jgi:hypothetical protein